MKRLSMIIAAASLLFAVTAVETSAQSLLKKLGDAVKNEVRKEAGKAVDRAIDKAVDGIKNSKSKGSSKPAGEKQVQVTGQEPQPKEKVREMDPRYKYLQDADIYFMDGTLKGTYRLCNDDTGLYIEIKDEYCRLTPCNKVCMGEQYNFYCTYSDVPLYIKDDLSDLSLLAQIQNGSALSDVEAEDPLFGTLNGHEWANMGLPSGTKWALCNVGGTSPEHAGGYYAWGETEEKSSYTEENYIYQGKTAVDISGSENLDVATAKWGKGWRLPTHEEFQELYQYCNMYYGQFNGRWGWFFTSRKTNQTIFFPSTGFKEWKEHRLKTYNGRYMISTPIDNTTEWVYHMFFSNERCELGDNAGFFAYSVRAVTR